MAYKLITALCLVAGLCLSAPASNAAPFSGKRVALVVGNSSYSSAPLRNPTNDARAMAKSLRELGFEVTLRENAGQRDLAAAVRQFGSSITPGSAAVFYFAGHGLQVKGRNYLVPTDADIQLEDEVPYAAIDVNLVLDKMETGKSAINIVILDACRNNPFARRFRSAATGLAQMDAPIGTLIAFATAPGAVAMDGTGEHGVYTKHLLGNIAEAGLPVEQLFKRVRIGVAKDTHETQVPWESSSLKGDFSFRDAQKPQAAQDKLIEEAVRAAAERAATLTAERMAREQAARPQQDDKAKAEQAALVAERERLLRERERLAAENEALRRKASEAAAPVALAAPTAVAARPASTTLAAGGLRPEVGDQWTYRFSDGYNNNFEYSVKVKEMSEESIVDEMIFGKSRHTGHFEAGLEVASRMVAGVSVREVSPYLQSFGPLSESGAWNKVLVPGAITPFKARLAGREAVTVPAGRFEALKIVIEGEQIVRGMHTRPLTIQVWYVPEVKRFVRATFHSQVVFVGNPADHDVIELLGTSLPVAPRSISRTDAKAVPSPVLASLAPASGARSAGLLPSVGDAWTYRYVDKVYGRSETYTVRVTAASENEIADEARIGKLRDALVHEAGLGFAERRLGSLTIRELAPYLLVHGPLQENPEWNNIQRPGLVFSAKSAGTETVTVPAGTFEAYKLLIDGYKLSANPINLGARGRFLVTAWYAPRVKRFVKMETDIQPAFGVSKEQETIELGEYRLQ